MSKIKNLIKAGAVAAFAVAAIATPSFASTGPSPSTSGGNATAGAFNPASCNSTYKEVNWNNNGPSGDYVVKCNSFNYEGTDYTFYGKTRGACATVGIIAGDPVGSCVASDGGLETIVRTIISTIIFVVGILAVIMIILGGISYATSQGDSSKVKKGKDTILYGIVGLVISILAYAIVQFVLRAVNDN